ncbi:helix-turn-helix transcriptional regulator [Georgenia alba]|uniref:Helix-turn-helix transcriptional regulator n=1 Tax=Georgenia alba TaxID=2233858 RepID=A0ABW2Q2V2_9MICO
MGSDLSPTARALRTLELLQERPGITADRLAERLGVTERAARRYVAILREADVPVTSTRGRYGGYRLGRGVRLPPLVFSPTEALGLVMAVLDGSHAASDDGEPVGAALGKLIRALPDGIGRPAATMRRHASAAPDRRSARPDPETTSVLVTSVAAARRVQVGYRGASGKPWEETVDPWAVVVRHGLWYLLCYSHRAGAVRTYRVDRVRSVTLTDESFDPPEDFDPVARLEQHLGTGWPYETRVVFEAPLADVARYVTPAMGALEPLDGGARCVLVGTTNNPAMYAGEWLAGFPFTFHVDGGPELRDAVAELAERLAAAVSRIITAPSGCKAASRP